MKNVIFVIVVILTADIFPHLNNNNLKVINQHKGTEAFETSCIKTKNFGNSTLTLAYQCNCIQTHACHANTRIMDLTEVLTNEF